MTTEESEKEGRKTDALSVLFPEEIVEMAGDNKIIITPLSLFKIRKVTKAFSTLIGLAEKGATAGEMAAIGLDEIMDLIPECIDWIPEEVPAEYLPEIIDIMLKQNMNEAIIKKWTALVDQILAMSEKISADGKVKAPQKKKV